ncbi:MAG: response regulator [Cytophagales bacterium]|nr:response regulator [Cytophagales bacterium]
MSEIIKILLIEDEPFDKKNFARSIKNSGLNANLSIESNAEDGLRNLLQNKYDIIFLDYKLPGEDGLELLKKIRQKGITEPVIIITSQEDEALAMSMVKAGADDYIPKSLVTVDGLVQIIRSALRYHKLSGEKQKAQDNLEILEINLKSIIESSSVIIFQVNRHGIFELLEGEASKFLGSDQKGVVGKSIFEIYKDNLSLKEVIRCALTGNKVKNTVQIGDSIFDIDCTPIIKGQNEVHGVHGVVKDATQRARIIEQLIEAKLEAEKTAKVKDTFLANMSHEIRTPISAIIGFTDLLFDKELSGEQYEYVNSIKLASENLLVIVNDILDFSKIEAGKLTLKHTSFNLTDLMDSLKKVLKPQAKIKHIDLLFDIDEKVPAWIMGDPVRLHQILLNLIGNALKFTNHGWVGVAVSCKEKKEDAVLLSFRIVDTGIGIPQEEIAVIFESFTQVNTDPSREYGGTGLGLTIVKRLIELQNGHIEVQSEVNKGTTFVFELMFKMVAEKNKGVETALPSFVDESSLNGKKVLLVEDNDMIQVLAQKYLESWHILVDVVDNGRLAMEKLENGVYDLVLMDIRMPEMNGFETTKKIRSKGGKISGIPIIAMTAHAFEKEKQKCLAMGMNDYISKPFKPAVLKEKLLGMLSDNRTAGTDTNSDDHPGEIRGEVGICDFGNLKAVAGDNPELMKELIEIYINMSEEIVESMKLNQVRGDLQGLRADAHKFLNSVSTIGIPKLTSLLNKVLDKKGKPMTKPALESILQSIGKLVLESQVELKNKINEMDSAIY